jgi:putative transposase
MSRQALRIQLSGREKKELKRLLAGGLQQVRVVLRALALQQLAAGSTAPQVARTVALTAKSIRQLVHRYEQGGLERALHEKSRPGAAPLLDASQKQRVIAMVCGPAPEGRARWTVRLIAEEAVKRKLVPRVGRETLQSLLNHHDLKPWREKNVVHRRVG